MFGTGIDVIYPPEKHPTGVVEAAQYGGTRITARCALEENRYLFAVAGNLTSRNFSAANTLIHQRHQAGRDLGRTPGAGSSRLIPVEAPESPASGTASLFREEGELAPHEEKICALLKADEATHIDQIIERQEPELSS